MSDKDPVGSTLFPKFDIFWNVCKALSDLTLILLISSCLLLEMVSENMQSIELSSIFKQAKSRKYQGVFKVKSRVETWQVRGIWSQQLEHKQVPKGGGGWNQVSGRVSVPCWHATPVANAQWKPFKIR